MRQYGRPPVFVKNGAIIPMAEENNPPAGVKGASPRIFEVWPSGETDFTLFEDDGYSTDYYNGAYALTNINVKCAERAAAERQRSMSMRRYQWTRIMLK